MLMLNGEYMSLECGNDELLFLLEENPEILELDV